MTKLITSFATLAFVFAATVASHAITLQSADGPAEFGPAPQIAGPVVGGSPKVGAAARGAFAMQPGTDTSREAVVMTSQ